MDIHVQLKTLAGVDAVELGFKRLGLDAVAGRWALVILSARLCAGSSALIPVVRPVAVDITADAACGWCTLPVLAPQAVRCLREGEAVRVHDRENVEIVSILERSRGSVREQLERGVFNDLNIISVKALVYLWE